MAGTASPSQITLKDFQGGVNYAMDLSDVASNESPNAMNMEFWPDRVAKRKGYEALTSAVSTTDKTGHSIVDFGIASGEHYQVVHIGDKVYQMKNLSGTLTIIRNAAPAERSYNAKIKSYLVQTYDDGSKPYYWDGTAASMVELAASVPGFKRAIEFQGYILGMSTTTNKMRIYYEDVNTMIGGTYANYFTLTPAPNDDIVTEPFLLNGRCYVGSKYAIFRVSFVGGVTVFDYKQVVTGVGIVPNSLQIVVSKEFGQVAMFLGYDRQIYVFDGANVKVISDKYFYPNRDTIFAMQYVDEAFKENAYSAYDPIRQAYRLAVTRSGDQTNKYMVNINVQSFAYYPYDNMVFNALAICYDQINRQFLIGAGYDGKLYKLFTNVNTDDGAAIIEVFDFPVMVYREHTVTKGGTLELLFKPVGKYNLQLWARENYETAWQRVKPDLPMYDTRDRFLGITGALGQSFVLGPEQAQLSQGVSISKTFNNIQYRLTSGGSAGDLCTYITGTVSGVAGTTSITGVDTVWTSDMTAAKGWKIWINSGVHKNYIYDFTRTGATTATVSTLSGTAPTNDFATATYVVYRQGYAACGLGWELLKTNMDGSLTMSGHTDVQR